MSDVTPPGEPTLDTAIHGFLDTPIADLQPAPPAPGTIAFDIDGVLANFTRGFTRLGNKLFGTPVGDAQSQQCWMFEEFPELGLDKAKCSDIWKHIINADEVESKAFWANLDPLNPSILYMIDQIKNKLFITNRPGVLPREQSIIFLERWGVTSPTVILGAEKGPVAVAQNVVATVDDYSKNCYDIKGVLPSCYVAMLYTPYNKVHHADWLAAGGEVVLSVDQFILTCNQRGLVQWHASN